MKINGLIHKTAYIFHRHYLFGWTLTRWFILALFVPPLLVFLKIIPWGQSGLIAVSVISSSLFVVIWRTKRRGYLHFKADEDHASPAIPSTALPPSDKIPLRASGNFVIRGVSRYFVEEAAFYQTFATRERVIMINIPFTRFMLLSHSPEAEIGWWYSFFTPQNLLDYQLGTLYFGSPPRPALRLTYQPDGVEKNEILYLSFDTSDQRARVLADLKVDLYHENDTHRQP